MTGKSFLFTQTVPKNIIGPPILVGNYKQSLEELPLQDNEILIYEQFANNNLKIGDKYNIVNRTFTVRGFVTIRNSVFIANNISGLMDPKNKTVAFVIVIQWLTSIMILRVLLIKINKKVLILFILNVV
ncbi:hypothetical protein [Spiroplasma ixodetis]|uniref:hypothetical protein n=1 Tax=Spiroplasma ixodetis TaxID=2141 RepID=UPI002577C158|nr:hypothetical protein [Spiroplasma ixodetis]